MFSKRVKEALTRDSEINQRLAEIGGLRGDALTDEIRAEQGTLLKERAELQPKLREALDEQERHDALVTQGNGGSWAGAPSEVREARGLLERGDLGGIISDMMNGREVDPLYSEIRAAFDCAPGAIPWPMFCEVPDKDGRRHEGERAADLVSQTPANIPVMQEMFINYTFPNAMLTSYGVRPRMASGGSEQFPVITAVPGAAVLTENADFGATRMVISPEVFNPNDVRTRVVFSNRQSLLYRGHGAAVRRNLAGAIGDTIDKIAVNGQAASGDAVAISGFFSEIPDPDKPGAVVTAASALESIYELLDGRFAYTTKDLRAVVPPRAMQKHGGILFTGTDVTLAEKLKALMGVYVCNANAVAVPDAGAREDVATFGVAKTGGMFLTAAVVLWPSGVSVIVDRQSKDVAQAGQTAITLNYYMDSKRLQEDAWDKVAHDLA